VVDEATRQAVRDRAQDRCEYCRVPNDLFGFRHSIDHIIAVQHAGSSTLDNLALCCIRCNRKKGPNLSGIDAATGQMTALFNPRTEKWSAHFRWSGAEILGTTAIGRTTVAVLDLNHADRLKFRESLIAEGILPR
jgi:hypothetical protein